MPSLSRKEDKSGGDDGRRAKPFFAKAAKEAADMPPKKLRLETIGTLFFNLYVRCRDSLVV